MVARLLGRGRQAKDLGFAVLAHESQAGEPGLALGQGPRLVEREGVARRQALEGIAALDQDSVAGEPGHAGQHRRGSGQHQRARAGDHQHGHGPRPDVGPAQQVAGQQGDARRDLHGRQEVPRQAVGRPLEVGLAQPCLRDHADHLAERGLAPDLLGANLDRAELVERAGENPIRRPLVHRNRLAGQRRLIDRRAARLDRTVDRNPLARPDDHQIPDRHVAGGNLDLGAVPPHPGRRGVWSTSRPRARLVRANVTASSTSPTRAMKTTSAATNGWPSTSAATHACASARSAPIRPCNRASSAPYTM